LAIAMVTFVLGVSLGAVVSPTAQTYLIGKAAEVCAPNDVAVVTMDRIECHPADVSSTPMSGQPT
jgi:hypothetical protein